MSSAPINIPGAKGSSAQNHHVSASYFPLGTGSSTTSAGPTYASSAPQFRSFEDEASTSPAYLKTVRLSSGFLWDENVLSPRKSYMRGGNTSMDMHREEAVQVAEIRLDDDDLLPS